MSLAGHGCTHARSKEQWPVNGPRNLLAPFVDGCHMTVLFPPPEDESLDLGLVVRLEVLRVIPKPGDPKPHFWLLYAQPGYHREVHKAHVDLIADWWREADTLVLQGTEQRLRLGPLREEDRHWLQVWDEEKRKRPELIPEADEAIRAHFAGAHPA